jgi:hypothetical protein
VLSLQEAGGRISEFKVIFADQGIDHHPVWEIEGHIRQSALGCIVLFSRVIWLLPEVMADGESIQASILNR